MPRVVLQPSSNKDAREHYRDTIEAPVRFADHASLLGPEEAGLRAAFPSGAAAMWGVTPSNETKWDRFGPGDITLFSRDSHFFGVGTMVLKFHNEPLARALWRENNKGETWEFMYALDEVRSLSIPYPEMSRIIGYKPNHNYQGFTVLDEEKSERVLDALDLYSEAHEPPVSANEFRTVATQPPTDLDVVRQSMQRKESRYVRQKLGLTPDSVNQCDLCGESMPSAFLVGAHIKKRSACTDEEKLDIPNVVMAACVFGCDALYEKGYVTVGEDWTLQAAPSTGAAEVDARLARLAGRSFPHRNEGRQRYTAWHRANAFRG